MSLRIAITCSWIVCTLLVLPRSTEAQDIEGRFSSLDVPWLSFESSSEPEAKSETEQQEEEIETDRDSFTPATTTTPTGRTIFESSYSYLDDRSAVGTHSFPEILTRYGLTDRLELRVGWNYEVGSGGSVSNGDAGGELQEPGLHRESQMLFGCKYSLTKQRDWIPQSACIIQGTTPTSGPESFTDFQLAYAFGWKFFNGWEVDSSIRYLATKEEGDHFNEWAPSILLKAPIADRWHVHAEYFGTFTDGRAVARNAQYFSPGISYLITPGLEIGVRTGWGLNPGAAAFFSNVGFGVLF